MKPESIEKQLMTLDDDEKELLDSIENNEWIPNYETSEQFELRKVELMKAARETLKNYKQQTILFQRLKQHRSKILSERGGKPHIEQKKRLDNFLN